MNKKKQHRFTHESLQDSRSITKIIESLAQGMERGKLTFHENSGEITLKPEGLLNFKIKISQEEEYQEIKLQIRWRKKGKKRQSREKLILTV